MSQFKLIDRKTGKRRWVGKAKEAWSPAYVDFNNKKNHIVVVNSVERTVSFVHNAEGPRQAVHFRIEESPNEGWYFLYDADFNIYTTKYDFELVEVDEDH